MAKRFHPLPPGKDHLSKDDLRKRGEQALKSVKPTVHPASKRRPGKRRVRYAHYCSSRTSGKVN